MSYKDGYGLREKQDDGTEFRVGALVRLKPKAELPKKFIIDVPDSLVKNQTHDTCAKEELDVLLSLINGYPVDSTLTWTIARANGGYAIEDYGVTIKEILMAAVKQGAPKYEESQYHSNDDRSIFADITKWDLKDQQPKAIVNKAGTAVFVEPTNGMDLFDSIRSTIVTLNVPVLWGLRWNYDPMEPKILASSPTGYGHCKLMLGYDDEQADIVDLNISLNSWGLSVGIKGRYFVSRETVNTNAAIFGAGTLIDETPEKVKWYLENGIYLNDGNWLLNTAKAFIIAMKRLLTIALDERKIGTVPPYPLKVVKMAEAIKKHEGWSIGSRAYRNNSPSNAKYIGQYKSIGADAQGFARFATYEDGWNYLLKIIYNACSGKSAVYPQTMTLYEYFAKYAPASDNNDSKHYAEVVAEYIGVSPFIQIKDLIV